MGKKRRESPEINAGSMADIAFLLLIFFLVTTTIASDKGLTVRLPPKMEKNIDVEVKAKKYFQSVDQLQQSPFSRGRIDGHQKFERGSQKIYYK